MSDPLRGIEVSRPCPQVVRLSIDRKVRPEFGILLRSDAHVDSICNDWDKERQHLDAAKDRGGLIVDLGDILDVMMGKDDKRQEVMLLHDKLRKGVSDEGISIPYYDACLEFAAERYRPYAENWIIFKEGNHESAVRTRHGTNLTSRLASDMRQHGSKAEACPYTSFLSVYQHWGGGGGSRLDIALFHGAGGIRSAKSRTEKRVATFEADMYVSGHIHAEGTLPTERWSLDQYGNIERKEIHHIFLPGYKKSEPFSGWAAEREMGVGTTGAYWLDFGKSVCTKTRRFYPMSVRRWSDWID